jgi:taurine dioxygenase
MGFSPRAGGCRGQLGHDVPIGRWRKRGDPSTTLPWFAAHGDRRRVPSRGAQLLAGLTGLHGRSAGPAGERLYGDDKGVTEKKYEEVPWPAVTRHPVTGRSVLFVNPMHTHGFVGMKREEAWPLIEELAGQATRERFVYYHRWRVGDVLMWDERATMHRGAGDYRPDERRIMLCTIVYSS